MRVDLAGRLAVKVDVLVRVVLAADPSPTTGGPPDCGDVRLEDVGFLGWFQLLKKSSSAEFADTGVDTEDLLVSSFSRPCLPGRLQERKRTRILSAPMPMNAP